MLGRDVLVIAVQCPEAEERLPPPASEDVFGTIVGLVQEQQPAVRPDRPTQTRARRRTGTWADVIEPTETPPTSATPS